MVVLATATAGEILLSHVVSSLVSMQQKTVPREIKSFVSCEDPTIVKAGPDFIDMHNASQSTIDLMIFRLNRYASSSRSRYT